MKFGEQLKSHRIRQGLTLRACAFSMGVDPSNWSKIERGILPAPKDAYKWAVRLDIFGVERVSFLDAASISRKELPSDIASDEDLIPLLPLFFDVMRKVEISELISDLRKVCSA